MAQIPFRILYSQYPPQMQTWQQRKQPVKPTAGMIGRTTTAASLATSKHHLSTEYLSGRLETAAFGLSRLPCYPLT